jgi:ADP-heptose:LPS heptosyltransferase
MKILINRTDAIGDTILTLPLQKAIQNVYPEAKVQFLVTSLVAGLGDFDFISYPKKEAFWKRFLFLLKLFRKEQYTHYLYVGGDHLASFLALILMFNKWRGGLLSRWPSFLFLNRGVRQKRSEALQHEVAYNCDLLAPLGIKANLDALKKESLFRVEKIQQQDYMVVHPGMTGHTRNWSSKSYAEIIKDILELSHLQVIISSVPKSPDEQYVGPLREVFAEEKRVLFWENREGLRPFMVLLKGASLFIGPSTGPTHLANALGVPVLGIYSPVKIQQARRWGPFFELNSRAKAKILWPSAVDCPQRLRCSLQSCPFYDCMETLKISREELKSYLKEIGISIC